MMVMPANSTGVEIGHLATKHPRRIGHLYSPGAERGPWPFIPYALDNGAFAARDKWEPAPWRNLLRWSALSGQSPLWALVPDVVADRAATIDRWREYVGEVTRYGFRPAFAAQDQMTPADVPTTDCVVFIGGSTEWKVAAIGPWSRALPGRIHVGRVTTWDRILTSYNAGAISVDGTGLFRSPKQKSDLVRFLRETS
jgi:hypothetical protein